MKRKVGFYHLYLNNDEYDTNNALKAVLDKILSYSKVKRKYDLSSDKFCYLEELSPLRNNELLNFQMKSASYNFRPNLVNSSTINERANPKYKIEGEVIKTHIATLKMPSDVILLMEIGKNQITINQFVKYLNNFLPSVTTVPHLYFEFRVMVKDNFMEELDNLSRVISADLIVEKQLLGSDALDYSNRLNTVQPEITISVKAKSRESILTTVKDFFTKFSDNTQSIKGITIKGRNHDNNEVIVNTEFIERQEYINARQDDDTGELIKNDVYIELNGILNNF